MISPDPPEHDIITDLATRLRLDEDEEEEDQPIPKTFGRSPESQSWQVLVPGAQESVQACVLGFGGRLLITIGKHRVWIWRETTQVIHVPSC